VHHALQVLGAVEVLLLLEEVNVAGDRDAANCLAMLGVWKWDTLVVRKVRSIILADTALHLARDLRDDV